VKAVLTIHRPLYTSSQVAISAGRESMSVTKRQPAQEIAQVVHRMGLKLLAPRAAPLENLGSIAPKYARAIV